MMLWKKSKKPNKFIKTWGNGRDCTRDKAILGGFLAELGTWNIDFKNMASTIRMGLSWDSNPESRVKIWTGKMGVLRHAIAVKN